MVFSCIRTEFEDLLRKSPITVRIQIIGPEKAPYLDTFYAVTHFSNFNRSPFSFILLSTDENVLRRPSPLSEKYLMLNELQIEVV